MRISVEVINPKHFPKKCSGCARPIHPEVTFPGGWSCRIMRVYTEAEASVVFMGKFFYVSRLTCPRCTVSLEEIDHVS